MNLVPSSRRAGRGLFLRLGSAVRWLSSADSAAQNDIFEALEEEAEKDFGFDEWLKTTKAALADSKGKYWLGKSGPFPHNPAFVPRPVLSNAAKTRIYELFKQEPKGHDCRALSAKYKVSIERIKAIIRQKELELELAQKGNVVDVSYVRQMESNLECVGVADDGRTGADLRAPLPLRPVFVNVPEGRDFGFDDAKATLLALGINPKTPARERKEATESASDCKVTQISHSEFERSRSKFVFVNTSKKDEIDIVVRDTDGVLRTPTREELESAVKKTWNRNAPAKLAQ